MTYYKPSNVSMDEIRRVLSYIGVSRAYKGFETTAVAVYMLTRDPSKLDPITVMLYPDVGAAMHVESHCVERRIRTVIDAVWSRSPERFNRITGFAFPDRPTATEFLEALAFFFLTASNYTAVMAEIDGKI